MHRYALFLTPSLFFLCATAFGVVDQGYYNADDGGGGGKFTSTWPLWLWLIWYIWFAVRNFLQGSRIGELLQIGWFSFAVAMLIAFLL